MAVKAVAPMCELLLVVGSQNSSNSRRLVEVCEHVGRAGLPGGRLDARCKPAWLEGVETVAVTAGASAPENLVRN